MGPWLVILALSWFGNSRRNLGRILSIFGGGEQKYFQVGQITEQLEEYMEIGGHFGVQD